MTTQATLQQTQPKYVPAGSGPSYFGPGDRMTFLATSADTNGAFFMAEAVVSPGGGPPMHVHSHEDESFYVLQGTFTLTVGSKPYTASAGDFVHIPRGVPHTFKNIGDKDGKLLVVATPGGVENFFAEAFFPAADIADAPDHSAIIERVIKAAPKYGLQLLPPA